MVGLAEIAARNARAMAARERGDAAQDDIAALLRRPPYCGFVEASPRPGIALSMFLCNNDDGVALRLFWQRRFEPLSLALWTRLAGEADCILDVGAHTGIYSLAAGAANPDAMVVSLEPHAPNHARLLLNLAANGLPTELAYAVAASERDGPVAFAAPAGAYLSSGGAVAVQGASVPALALDSIAARLPRPPRLIKIDTEGHEAQVLAGARALLAAHRPDLLVESVFAQEMDAPAALLRSLGYVFHAIDDTTLAAAPVPDLAPRPGCANRLLTCRPADEVAALVREASRPIVPVCIPR